MATPRAGAIILAGGQSRRMGQPKATLPFGKTTVLERIVDELADAFDEVIIVAAPAAVEPYSLDAALAKSPSRVVVVRDTLPFPGPLPALIAGLRRSRHEAVFACSCDLPLLRAATARAIVDALGDHDAAVPIVDRQRQPLCAAYARKALGRLETAAAQEARLTVIVARLATRWLPETEMRQIEPDLPSFVNINTPADYARALQIAGQP
ncbi:MAG TPA: molybdenum cofactor guanylyltransferase [Candidatus Binataceae bacterium]|nr:molybdenum cofactor guanylyltransferase [Candidatus Binataceae bacterium]